MSSGGSCFVIFRVRRENCSRQNSRCEWEFPELDVEVQEV